MKELSKTLGGVLLGVAAVIMFALSAVSMFLDRSATAAIAAAVALTFILLIKLPIVESFEVLTLKVKLRNQVDEAQQLLSHIRSTASVTSKLSYIQLAFMNRMGSISWSQKRDLLADVDGMLIGVGIAERDISEWKRPFLNLITRDLVSIFWSSIEHLKRPYYRAVQEQVRLYEDANRPVAPDDPTLKKLWSERTRLSQKSFDIGDVLQGTHLSDPEVLTRDWLQPEIFDERELAALRTIQREICAHVAACWASGTITKGAEEYLGRFDHHEDTRVKELLSEGG